MLNHLINQNIWWQDASLIEKDPKIMEWQKQSLKWQPSLMDEFDFSSFHIYTLRGPRQVGKTTLLKLMIKKLLKDPEIRKEQIVYYSADNLDSYKDIIELIETYFDFLDRLPNPPERAFLFLDEITAVNNWQRGIKYLTDLGKLSNSILILSGSNASDLRLGIERLPGRRGRGSHPDKILLPLTFREYVSLTSPDMAAHFKEITFFDVFNLTESNFRDMFAFNPYKRSLSKLFDRYLISGGFIKSINELYSSGFIAFDIYEIYLQWIRGDMAKAGKNERTTRQIISRLLKITVSVFGWETIAKKIDIATHKTVSEYMQVMEDSFILRLLYQADVNTGLPRIKKKKKFYFLDPFILWSLWGWVENWLFFQEKSEEKLRNIKIKSCLAEMAVANLLFHRYEVKDWTGSRVFFFRNNGEIDFLIKQDNILMPVEVKYQNKIEKNDFKLINKLGFKKGVIISKDTFYCNNGYMSVPLEIFLMLF